MIDWIINKITGDYNQKQINKLLPIVDKINELYKDYNALSDEQVKNKTEEFKVRFINGENLDDMLPEAFAVVKQACKRLIGQEIKVKGQTQKWYMIPYDVQLLGGIILHKGIISEMKTGEGKTLVSVMPGYLNALSGNGVHIVTVNDYLASRDAEWMRPVYERLGLSVGCVVKGISLESRREEYSKDITYVENSELGFDYLRDYLVKSQKERNLMRRPLNYAIVDEIDSILIDEARTPLIISQPSAEPTEKYVYYAKIVKNLLPCKNKKKVSKGLLHEIMNDNKSTDSFEEDGDYYIDEKTKTVSISSKGISRLESILLVENLYKDLGYEEIHHIENALKAQAVYENDKEYIIKNGEVMIVDENTGRTMPGRRFSEGLHQAIEAKENVIIQRESKTMATITYQNFFKQYTKLAGMTGTATTEGEEFSKIYDLNVLALPTNKFVIRVDKSDKVYFSQKAKRKFVKKYIEFYHEIGQPILIGTSNIQTSEYVSNFLNSEGIKHSVLNAKFHEQEASIVANAGKYKSVVVATNMAGRGTDIKLDDGLNNKLADNYAKWIKKQILESGVSIVLYSEKEFDMTIESLKREFDLSDEDIRLSLLNGLQKKGFTIKITFNKSKKYNYNAFAEIVFKKDDILDIIQKDLHYGLFILGTEKHESRRIDNQLRGRAGRQGDPGISVFFVALDDLIMRKMGGERIQSMAGLLMSKDELEEMELSQKQFADSIVRAQKQMEGWHFSIRKHLFDYDSVIDKQRYRIYHKRDLILASENSQDIKNQFLDQTLEDIKLDINMIIEKQVFTAKQLKQSTGDFLEVLQKELNIKIDQQKIDEFVGLSLDNITEGLTNYIKLFFFSKLENIDREKLYLIFKDVFLHYIDLLRIKHIDEMQYLRDKVGLMGYAQLDPLVVYKKEAFSKFQTLLYRLKFDTTATLLGIDYSGLSNNSNIIVEDKRTESQYIDMLKQVASQSKVPQKAVFQDEDGFEIFELDSNKEEGNNIIDLSNKKKLRPNDLCSCGSGKKYKKCCG